MNRGSSGEVTTSIAALEGKGGLRVQAITLANQEMLRLQGEIAAERDPVRRAALELEMLS